MKKALFAFLVAALFLGGCSQMNPGIIYDTVDDRTDAYQIRNTDVYQNGIATGSLWSWHSLQLQDSGFWTYNPVSLGVAYNLHPNERFFSQPIGPHCTGFWVGGDIIVSAGHCLEPDKFIGKRFVLGFRMISSSAAYRTFEKNQVYHVSEILAHRFTSFGNDYVVARLDRPVALHTAVPVKIAKERVKVNDWVYMLGHPSGLPLKYTPNGKVLSVKDKYFGATVDAFGGNSGSPVFNMNHEVVGILVRGRKDYVTGSDGFRRVNHANMYYNGETIIHFDQWDHLVRDALDGME